jgi:hypothetical protein
MVQEEEEEDRDKEKAIDANLCKLSIA